MTFKYYNSTALIISIIILSGLIEAMVGKWVNPFLAEYLPIGSSFRVPTTVSILGLIFTLYNQFLWRFPVFNLLMAVPDMSGRYEGVIRYHWNGSSHEKKCCIEISQSASKIKAHTYYSNGTTENTSSRSLIEDIKLEDDGFFEIYLFYLNSGTKQSGGLDCHEGANKLRYIPADKETPSQLTGHYFTNRQTQTRGEIEAVFQSKKLKGKF
jgi:hypothetical protein